MPNHNAACSLSSLSFGSHSFLHSLFSSPTPPRDACNTIPLVKCEHRGGEHKCCIVVRDRVVQELLLPLQLQKQKGERRREGERKSRGRDKERERERKRERLSWSEERARVTE